MTKIHQKIISLQQSFGRSIVTQVHNPLFEQYNIEFFLKRDDLIHPVISGNKWRKLKYIVNHALSIEADRLVSMGGAYSNHLHALAYVAKQLGLGSTGIIRGERPDRLSPTLCDLEHWGMQLEFISRADFRELRQYKHFDAWPGQQYQGYWIAEGGSSPMAVKGVSELAMEIGSAFDIVCVPCGTGTTMAGLLLSLQGVNRVIGFSALKGAKSLACEINGFLQQSDKQVRTAWQVNHDYHFGGFARTNKALLAFIDDFNQKTTIALDPVYTGKMCYGIYDLIKQGEIQAGQRVLAIHTGGLQGGRVL